MIPLHDNDLTEARAVFTSALYNIDQFNHGAFTEWLRHADADVQWAAKQAPPARVYRVHVPTTNDRPAYGYVDGYAKREVVVRLLGAAAATLCVPVDALEDVTTQVRAVVKTAPRKPSTAARSPDV